MEEFVIARNPDAAPSLPYLLRLPLASGAVVLKAKDTWPRTSKIYCHPADGWPAPALTGDEARSGGSGDVSGRASAAIVVEDRYSAIFKLRHVRPVSIATQLAEAAVRYPAVPIVFAETRQLAQEWTFRFFGAAVDHALHERVGEARTTELFQAGSVPHRAPAPAEVRAWAVEHGLTVSDRGRIPMEVMRAYLAERGSS